MIIVGRPYKVILLKYLDNWLATSRHRSRAATSTRSAALYSRPKAAFTSAAQRCKRPDVVCCGHDYIGHNYIGHRYKRPDIACCVPSPVLRKFDKFQAMQSDPNSRECPKCQHLTVGKPDAPDMRCAECKEPFCFHHADAHPGKTCAEAQMRAHAHAYWLHTRMHTAHAHTCAHTRARQYGGSRETVLAKTMSAIRKWLLTKPCPKCKIRIQKNGGCEFSCCSGR